MTTYLEDDELAGANIALAHDIKNAAERLMPLLDKTNDPVEMDHLLKILQAANKIRLLNKAKAQLLGKKNVTKEIDEIIHRMFEDDK